MAAGVSERLWEIGDIVDVVKGASKVARHDTQETR